MTTASPIIKGHKFVIGYHEQDQWSWLVAAAFFFGKIGGGLFFLSLLLGNLPGILLGTIIVAVGKGGAHLLYLGRPERFWRAMLQPQTSWVARGFIATTLLIVFGAIFGFVAPPYSLGLEVLRVIALIVALVVMIYDGFLMNYSPAISFWNNAMVPVLCLFYALLGGSTLTLVLTTLLPNTLSVMGAQIELLEISVLALNLILITIYLLSAWGANSGAKISVKQLLFGKYRWPFFLGVVVVGVALTAIFAWLFMVSSNVIYLGLLVAADLIGHFMIFYLLLKVGVFTPPRLRGMEP